MSEPRDEGERDRTTSPPVEGKGSLHATTQSLTDAGESVPRMSVPPIHCMSHDGSRQDPHTLTLGLVVRSANGLLEARVLNMMVVKDRGELFMF